MIKKYFSPIFLRNLAVPYTKPRLYLGLILAIAVIVRAVYFIELSSPPSASQHLWDQSDMYFFDQWAKTIASGDWLTDRSLHPFNDWQKEMVQHYFGEKTPLAPEQTTAILERWSGGKIFHQEPLYPYLVALIYKLCGENVRWVFLLQMVLGVSTIILIFRITRRHFGLPTGMVAAVLSGICGPLLYYEMLLHRTTLITFMGLLIVDQADLALARENRLRWLVFGGCCGLAITIKSTFLLFVIGIVAVLIAGRWRHPRALITTVGCITAGITLALSPVIARNIMVGVSPLVLSSVGSIVFIDANVAEPSGENSSIERERQIVSIMQQSNESLLAAIIPTMRTHPNLISILSLFWHKLTLVWNCYEIPNNSNFYYYQLEAPVLRYLVTFLLLTPLSLLGIFLARKHIPTMWPIFLLVTIQLSVLLVFNVLSRHRVSLMAALVPFAALTLVSIYKSIQQQQIRKLAMAFAFLFIATWWTSRPLQENNGSLISGNYYMVPILSYYIPEINAAANRSDWTKINQLYEGALRYESSEIDRLYKVNLLTADDVSLLRLYADVHRNYGHALLRQGNEAAAAREQQRSEALLSSVDGL